MRLSLAGRTAPGATPVAARALAPDLARGGMLLLIARANVHLCGYGEPIGPRGYPREIAGVDEASTSIRGRAAGISIHSSASGGGDELSSKSRSSLCAVARASRWSDRNAMSAASEESDA